MDINPNPVTNNPELKETPMSEHPTEFYQTDAPTENPATESWFHKKFKAAKAIVIDVAKDPVTWVAVGLCAYYAIGRRQGYKAGYKKGIEVGTKAGVADGAYAMGRQYSDVLNSYDVRMPPELMRDVRDGKIWFLESPIGGR